MATTLRVNKPMRLVHILSVGDFGEAVARRIAEVAPSEVTPVRGSTGRWPAEWPLADVRILCSWRPEPALAGELDTASFAWKVPWFSVVAEHPFLRVGPAVVPGVGPCEGCFRARALQHSPVSDLLLSLYDYYDKNSDAGPLGYLPTHATLAAAWALELVEAIERAPSTIAGAIRRLHVPTHDVMSGRVVGVHGCRHCGAGADETDRSYVRLLRDLDDLAGGAST